jgi:hypothetical protein
MGVFFSHLASVLKKEMHECFEWAQDATVENVLSAVVARGRDRLAA